MTDIIVRRDGAVGRLSLDRPRALNALTHAMCDALSAALLAWRDDASVEVVLLDHTGGRGFCAGGDVAQVRRSVLEGGGAAGRAFFRAEYRLNHLLFTYPKPVIAIMDGVTMGGGAGLALPCCYRIATEATLFAMPEGAIGLFPDVGMGWHLPRLPGRTGVFLALTGARLDAAECLWAGIATHYLPASRLADARRLLVEAPDDIDAVLRSLQAAPPPARIAGNAERIDRLFASDRLDETVAALAGEGSDWARKELKAVASKCPTTAWVALRLLAQGARRADFAEEMEVEYRLAARMIMRPDFAEGVRAVLVDKDHAPRWDPPALEDVSEPMLDAIFAPLPAGEEWTPFPL